MAIYSYFLIDILISGPPTACGLAPKPGVVGDCGLPPCLPCPLAHVAINSCHHLDLKHYFYLPQMRLKLLAASILIICFQYLRDASADPGTLQRFKPLNSVFKYFEFPNSISIVSVFMNDTFARISLNCFHRQSSHAVLL
jgi:hypothetical protein